MNPVELNVSLRLRGCTVGITLAPDFLGNCFGPEPFFHSHPKYELHAVTSGRCLFVFEGGELACGEGDFALLPPHLRHKVLPRDGAPVSTVTFALSLHREGEGPVGDALIAMSTPVRLPDRFGGIGRLLSVRRELRERGPAWYEKVCGELTCLLAELARGLSREQPASPLPREENRPEQIEAYLAENYQDPSCGCRELAKRLHLSQRQLHRICVQSFGQPFRELLTRTRLEVASHRLRSTRLPVSVIALQLGFSSPAAFSAAYRRQYGHPPSQGRETAEKTQETVPK